MNDINERIKRKLITILKSTGVDAPETPQELYGDLAETTDAQKEKTKRLIEKAGSMAVSGGSFIPSISSEQRESEGQLSNDDLENLIAKEEKEAKRKREEKYGVYVDIEKIKKLENEKRNLENQLDYTSLPGLKEKGSGQPTELLPTKSNMELEKEIMQIEGLLTSERSFLNPEGVRIEIPTPDNATKRGKRIIAQAYNNSVRGLQQIMGVPVSDQTPRLVDDDTLVNLGSEVLQIASTVPTGILGTKVLAGKILMHSPRAVKYVSSILTAGLAEAAITDTEQGSLSGELASAVGADENFITDNKNLQGKINTLIDAVALPLAIPIAKRGAAGTYRNTVGRLPVVRNIVEVLPVLLGISNADDIAKETLIRYIAIAENAYTPEDRMKALNNISKHINEQFKKSNNKGIDLDTYMRMSQQEKDDILGKDFIPNTMADLATGNPSLKSILGSQQREAIKTTAATDPEQLAELIKREVKKGESQKKQLEILKTDDEKAGERAQAKASKVTEQGKIQNLKNQEENLKTLLDEAREEISGNLGKVNLDVNAKEKIKEVKDNVVDSITKTFHALYTGKRKIKNNKYEEYLSVAEEIPVDLLDEGFDPRKVISEARKKNVDPAQALFGDDKTLRALANRIFPVKKGKIVDLTGSKNPSLKEIERALAAVNAKRNTSNNQVILNAATAVGQYLERLRDKTLKDNEALIALRGEADTFYKQFKQSFDNIQLKKVYGGANDNWLFGDKFNEIQGASARDAMRGLLKNATTENPNKAQAVQNLKNILNGLSNDTVEGGVSPRQDFLNQIETYIEVDFFDKINLDLNPQTIVANPMSALQSINNSMKKARENLNFTELLRDKDTNSLGSLNEVKERIDGLIEKSNDILGDKNKNPVLIQETINDIQKQIKQLTERNFNEANQLTKLATLGSPGEITTRPNVFIKELFRDDINSTNFNNLYERATPELKEEIKEVVTRGIFDEIQKANSIKIEDIMNRPAFKKVFENDEQVVELLTLTKNQLEMAETDSVEKLLSRGGTRIPSSDSSIDDVKLFAENYIKFIQGPLSKEGRQSSMLVKFFFKLLGKAEDSRKYYLDMLMDPTLGKKVLDDTVKHMKKGLNQPDAYSAALVDYLKYRTTTQVSEEILE